MAKITLGGERLGTGGKMTVNLPNFGRSSHDQGMIFTTDMPAGPLVPCYCNIALRGDTIYLDRIESVVRTLPTAGPVFGAFKQQIDVFVAPIRLYIGALHNNATGIGTKMEQVKFPKKKHITTVYAQDLNLKNPNKASVSPSSLGAYLGQTGSKTGGGYVNTMQYKENSIFELMYWDVYKNYYANKQEEEGVVISGDQGKTYSLGEAEGSKIEQVASNGETTTILPEQIDLSGITQYYYTNTVRIDTWNEAAKVGTKMTISIPTQYRVNENKLREYLQSLYTVQDGKKTNKLYGDNSAIFQSILTNTGDRASATIIRTLGGGAQIKGPWSFGMNERKIQGEVELERFKLSNIDKMREKILATQVGDELITNEDKTETGVPYNVDTRTFTDKNGLLRERRAQDLCGLAIKTHLSDIFNNWLQTDWLDGDNGINDITAIDTSSGSFSVNTFIMDYKLFRMMNKIAISDGSYDAWQTAVYGTEGRVITESPIYCGGYSSEIGFNEVVSSAATGEEPLGSLAGRGAEQGETRKGGKGIKIKCDEASLIMIIVSFTPRNSYSQFQDWWMQLDSMDDLHKPDLDGIMFQDLLDCQMATFSEIVNSDGTSTKMAIGKQTPWIEYTTNFNRSHGSFAAGGELEHMVLNRSYQANTSTGHVINATSYINPTEVNTIFADTSLIAKPFWVQIAFDETSRRVMSASQMPTL